MYAVIAVFPYCLVVCFKVNCTVGNVMTDIKKRLQLHLVGQGKHQGPYRFMLLAEKQRVMETV